MGKGRDVAYGRWVLASLFTTLTLSPLTLYSNFDYFLISHAQLKWSGCVYTLTAVSGLRLLLLVGTNFSVLEVYCI